MEEGAEATGLPPLSPSHISKQKRNTNKLSQSMEIVNPVHVKREVTRLYPRVQALERELASIRQQIPCNLGKTVLQLSQDVQKMKSGATQSSSDASSGDFLAKQIIDLENRLIAQLEMTMKEGKSDFEKRIENIEKAQIASNKTSEMNDIDEIDSEVIDRLRSIESLAAQQRKKNQTKVTSLEQTLAKLNTSSSISETMERVSILSTEVDSQRRQIGELRMKLSELRRDVESAPVRTETTVVTARSEQDETTTKPIAPLDIPDLSRPLNDLQEDMSAFKQLFAEAVASLQQKASACDEKLGQVTQLASSLTDSTMTLEARVTEADGICQEILAQMKTLASKIEDDSNKKTLQSLAIQLKTVHDSLKTEISAVKNRVKKCEALVPLVWPDNGQ